MTANREGESDCPDPDKPGSLALAVVQEMKADVFKKPWPVCGAKRKLDVLDEETYLEVSSLVNYVRSY